MDEAPYRENLKKLADYQIRAGGVVFFQMREQDTSISGSWEYVVEAFGGPESSDGAERFVAADVPIGQFEAWERAGYIHIVTGGLIQDGCAFRLTDLGLRAAGEW